MKRPDANLQVTWLKAGPRRYEFDIRSDVFAHAVHFNLGVDARLSDEYFDLLPGETMRIIITNAPDSFDPQALRAASLR